MKRKTIILLVLYIMSVIAGCSDPVDIAPKEEVKATPTPTAAAPTPTKEVIPPERELLDKLTLEQKLGQILIAGIPKGSTIEQIREYVDDFKAGGFILYPRNYSSLEEMYRLIAAIKDFNKDNPLALFVSTDEEGGTVSRLPKGAIKFPDARLIGRVNKPAITARVGEVMGRELSAFGVNMNFAPVLDIVNSSENRFLYKRTFGGSADIVSAHGAAFIAGLQSRQVIAVAKHFPGHGATTVDSHGKLPVIDIDKDILINRELAPYTHCFDQGLEAVMVGHLAFPNVDPSGLPSSMSKVLLTDILRKELGFKGLVIMDDIEMYGFLGQGGSFEASVIQAFNSGVDVFLVCHTRKVQNQVLEALKTGVADGRISMERLDEAVMRVISLKLKYKLTDDMKYSLEEVKQYIGKGENKVFYDTLMREIEKVK
ncbi:MAG: beta-N-acetylhexosaminidase [Bacillota bacterium]